MVTDSSSNITWQKLTVIITVLILVLPAVARFAWEVVFPSNYITYEVMPITEVDGYSIGMVIVANSGTAQQQNVSLYLPSSAINSKDSRVEISDPKKYFLSSIYDAKPKVSLQKYFQEAGYKIPLGNINADESIRVTIVLKKDSEFISPRLSFDSTRIESSSMLGIEANGTRMPKFADDAHSIYMQVSPFLLGFMLFFGGIVFFVSFIHDAFFDTHQKQMSRLWRKMDNLQEQIEKERRYL